MERVDPGGVPPPAEPAYGVVRARPSVGGIPVIAAQLVSPPTPVPMKLEPERLDPEPEPGAAAGAVPEGKELSVNIPVACNSTFSIGIHMSARKSIVSSRQTVETP